MADDMTRHYEVLRSQILTDEGDRILNPRNISAGILISQGIIGWSKMWGRWKQEMKTGGLVSPQVPDSDTEARGLGDMNSELRNILVNMTVHHIDQEWTHAKEEKL